MKIFDIYIDEFSSLVTFGPKSWYADNIYILFLGKPASETLVLNINTNNLIFQFKISVKTFSVIFAKFQVILRNVEFLKLTLDYHSNVTRDHT